MAKLYADENFDKRVVVELRNLGHDVVRAPEVGQAGLAIPDPAVLAFAVANDRAVLTFNRRHFIKLHSRIQPHKGIIICTQDRDFAALAARIHLAIARYTSLDSQLLRIYRPATP